MVLIKGLKFQFLAELEHIEIQSRIHVSTATPRVNHARVQVNADHVLGYCQIKINYFKII